MIATAQLVYDARREWLSGTFGRGQIQMKAYSGGSRGHASGTPPKLASEYLYSQAGTLSSHLATTKEEKDSHGRYTRRGGTLPPGHYVCHYIAHHRTFGECIQLMNCSDSMAIFSPFSAHPIPHGRDKNGFFIHGSGAKGSDGCIVPASRHQRLGLNKAVKDFRGKVILQVRNVSYMLPAELSYQVA